MFSHDRLALTMYGNMKKVLIADGVDPYLVAGFESAGWEVTYLPAISREESLECIAAFDGVVINSRTPADRRFLECGVKLRFVARLGSGLEIIDQPYAAERGIAVINSPEGNMQAVAEHALGMLLALLNNLPEADRQIRGKKWQREAMRGRELAGRTVGIIGMGHTGTAFARLLQGFENKVVGFDPYRQPSDPAYRFAECVDLSALLQQSDVISLHVPLTSETKHMVDARFLSSCRHGAILINTSRGGVVDTEALLSALDAGQLRGACLDVFENEQVHAWSASETAMYERLYSKYNVVLTPHIAGWTHESKYKIAKVLIDKLSLGDLL